MPIDIVPKSLYPFVPKALGVPPLLRSAAQLLDTATLGYLGIGDALSQLIGAEPIRWGVFDESGGKIAPYDSVYAVGYQNESKISNYPLEQGAFASYNKVETPFDVRVTLHCGGSEDDRAQFMASLETARKSLRLFTVLTPEFTYKDVNFTGLDISRRREEGVNMIIANLIGVEVRQKANANYSAPKGDAGFDAQDLGQVQTVDDVNIDVTGVV